MTKLYIVNKEKGNYDYKKIFGKVISPASIIVGDNIHLSVEIQQDNADKILAITNPADFGWDLPSSVLRKIPNLKGIVTKSSYYYYIDTKYCAENNIPILNNAGINSQSVAEYAIWMMLSLARRLPQQLAEGEKILLDRSHEQSEITHKVMGIIGLGHIGKRIAKMGLGLGMKVHYWNRKPKNAPYFYSPIDELLSQSDYIFNCLEVCEATKDFLSLKQLRLLKKSACYVSVLGGAGWGTVDDNELIRMVKEGQLGGYSIENDHVEDFKFKYRFSKKDNIFMPPAYAFYTKEANKRADECWEDNIKQLLVN